MVRESSPLGGIGRSLSRASWLLMAPGLGLVLLGMMVWAVPKLLEFIVAIALISLGLMLMAIAWHTRRMGQGYRRWRDDASEPFNNVRDGTPR